MLVRSFEASAGAGACRKVNRCRLMFIGPTDTDKQHPAMLQFESHTNKNKLIKRMHYNFVDEGERLRHAKPSLPSVKP